MSCEHGKSEWWIQIAEMIILGLTVLSCLNSGFVLINYICNLERYKYPGTCSIRISERRKSFPVPDLELDIELPIMYICILHFFFSLSYIIQYSVGRRDASCTNDGNQLILINDGTQEF